MDELLLPQSESALPPVEPVRPAVARRHGVSPGINIEPGSDDDGWAIPHPVTLADGTTLQLYKDGEALHAAYEAIRRAKWRVCIEVYIFQSDETGWAFADLLAKKASEGVGVYVVYDAFGCMGADRAMFRKMRRAGVRLAKFHPIKPWECHYSWRPANRNHRKLLIIDDDIAGLGGLNIGGEYAGSWVAGSRRHDCPWRDNAVGIRGRAAGTLMACFARTWRYVHHGGRVRQTQLIDSLDRGDFGVLATAPTRRSVVAEEFKRLVRGAQRSVLLTMSYFAPPDESIDELCAAARRGVDVRLMLPAVCDVPLMIAAARSFYARLLDAGVHIYERQGAVLHAKTLCLDGHTTVLGSTNLDYRSIEYNLELSVLIRSAEFGRQIHTLFENDIQYAKPITGEQWRRRPVLDRIVQWAVNRARYLL